MVIELSETLYENWKKACIKELNKEESELTKEDFIDWICDQVDAIW